MYYEPAILTDTEEPIRSNTSGVVWKAGGGETGFKASFEAVRVVYYPENDNGSQFVVKTSTPIGGKTVSQHGSKDEAVTAAIQYGRSYMSSKFEKISGL
jgi:hypothetical protein